MSLASWPSPRLAVARRDIAPAWANDAQRQFYWSHAPELLYSGAMGAGKSRILTEKAWRLALKYPGATFGIFRKVAASLPATTLRTFQRDVLDVAKVSGRNKQEGWYELRNGSRVYFLGLDPDPLTGVPSKVGSLDLAWAGVDEAVELTEADWIMLLGRLRDPRMPWHQLAAATNPGPPDHWLKQRFAPGVDTRLYVHATAADNRFLPADYHAMIAGLPDNAIGRRLGKGEWAAAEGVIWLLPETSVGVPIAPQKRVVAGIDWGFVHAFACEVVGQSGSGRLSVLDELYAHERGIDQLAEPLARLAERYDVGVFYCDPSEPGLMAELGRHFTTHRNEHAGCTFRARLTAANNDVMPGLMAVDKAIRNAMLVSPTCTGLLAEMPAYTWAPSKAGGFHERPIDVHDDACVTGDTLVWTARGQVPIVAVRAGDQVMTRRGWRAVLAAGATGYRDLVRVDLSSGKSIRCTPDHRFGVQDAWVRADTLRYAGRVCTRPPLATRLAASGPLRMVRSLLARTSTTVTATSRTTPWSTLSASPQASTHGGMWPWEPTALPPASLSSTLFALSVWHGTNRQKVEPGTQPTRLSIGPTRLFSTAPVTDAARRTPPSPATTFASAPTAASRQRGVLRAWTTRLATALSATARSVSTATRSSVSVRAVVPAGSGVVYNLTIDGEHEYFTNGALVHNCDALRYAVMAFEPDPTNPWAAVAGKQVTA